MKIYTDNKGQYYELLYTQNANTNAAPVEPTLWFQPLEYDTRGRAIVGLKHNAKEWPRPLAANIAHRVLTEFTGSVRDILPVEQAGKKTAPKAKNDETGDDGKA